MKIAKEYLPLDIDKFYSKPTYEKSLDESENLTYDITTYTLKVDGYNKKENLKNYCGMINVYTTSDKKGVKMLRICFQTPNSFYNLKKVK